MADDDTTQSRPTDTRGSVAQESSSETPAPSFSHKTTSTALRLRVFRKAPPPKKRRNPGVGQGVRKEATRNALCIQATVASPRLTYFRPCRITETGFLRAGFIGRHAFEATRGRRASRDPDAPPKQTEQEGQVGSKRTRQLEIYITTRAFSVETPQAHSAHGDSVLHAIRSLYFFVFFSHKLSVCRKPEPYPAFLDLRICILFAFCSFCRLVKWRGLMALEAQEDP